MKIARGRAKQQDAGRHGVKKMSSNRDLIPASVMAPGQNFDAYLTAIHSVSILSEEEEKALAKRFFHEQDLEAARQLVLSHLRFVVHIARTYRGYGLPLGDLVQEGNIGLMKAVRRFNPEVGVRLVSFAVHWIRAEIHEYILRNWRIVKIATTKAQRKLFFNLRSAKKKLAWLTQDELEAVAKDLDVSPQIVRDMEGRLTAQDAGFDGDADDEEASAPAHYLQDSRYDPADLLENEDWEEKSTFQLMSALDGLDARSQDILRRRWLTDDKATLHELAAEYGVSAERIRQIEAGALI